MGLSEARLSEPGASAELLVSHRGPLLHKKKNFLNWFKMENHAVFPGELLHAVWFV